MNSEKSSAPQEGRRAAIDIILVLGTLFIVKYTLLSIESMWTYAGPISLILSVIVASWRLKTHGETWAALGLSRPQSWPKIVGWSVIALVLTMLVGLFSEGVVNASIANASQAASDNSGRFANLPGNIGEYFYWLAVAWLIGGFIEEMIFRSFLITRFERLFAKLPFRLAFAIIIPAIVFGQQHHYYQGISGAIATGSVALVSGVLYILFKRSLWPLTISHGLANSIGLTMIFLGIQPAG